MDVEAEIHQLKVDVDVIKQTMATKADLAQLRTDIAEALGTFKADILKWYFVTVISSLGAAIAVFTALVR